MERLVYGNFEQFRGIRIIANDFIDQQSDYSLKGFSSFYRSKLTGLEKWLSLKLGFTVEIFTVIQKEYLKDKRKPNIISMGEKFICNKEGLEVISSQLEIKELILETENLLFC